MDCEPADPWLPLPYRVGSRAPDTKDTFSLTLEPADRQQSLSFLPGQFNMLYAFGMGEVPISISGKPGNQNLVHTIRKVGLVTAAFERMTAGDIVGVRGPFGSHWPLERAKGEDVLIMAGGIGLAPLRPIIYHCLAHPQDYRRVMLLYGARTPEDILYRQELNEWKQQGLQVQSTVDAAGTQWAGRTGVVTTLIPKANLEPASTHAFVCGPEIMMRFCLEDLFKLGISEDRLHLSMERNMKCATGFCGHCQYGPKFICKDGPVFTFSAIRDLFYRREL